MAKGVYRSLCQGSEDRILAYGAQARSLHRLDDDDPTKTSVMNAPLPSDALDTHATRHAGDRPPAVEVLSAEKVFANGTRALAPIDLTIAEGEFLTLIGPSGCGKSTLLKLIANLIEPTEGRILWRSRAFDKVGARGCSIAFVFQDQPLLPCAPVAPNVRLRLDRTR